MRRLVLLLVILASALLVLLIPSSPPVVHVGRVERKPTVRITGPNGAAPRYAVGDFEPLGGASAETATMVRDVIRQDLEFEEAFEVLDSDADGLILGTVRDDGTSLDVEARIVSVATGGEAFARGYTAMPDRARLLAHTVADEILEAQAGVSGVARTRLAFVSDRGGTRRELGGMIRRFKEVWTADYDGANQQRLTSDGDLDMTPSWAPDGRAIAYTSFRRGFQDIFITFLEDRRIESPTRGAGKNWLPAWSPDGRRLAFTSGRDGNEEIYVANADGSDVRRLTRHPAIDTSPAWSPDGRRLAFTSNRSGSPQIWVMDADGANPRQLTTEKYCDRPTWSPGPDDEIAYVSKTKTGFDIKVIDVATGAARQLTFGQGFNESPAFAPNGRHIAFASTRRGGEQVWVISRTGTGLRQVTTIGNNSMPAWSRPAR
jgi:TolB protein